MFSLKLKNKVYTMHMKFIIRLLLSAATLMLVAYVVPGIHVESPLAAIFAAFLLGIVNALIRPILVILTLPITILTLGIFIFVINAALFMGVASFVEGFSVDGFWPAIFGSLLTSVISSYMHKRM